MKAWFKILSGKTKSTPAEILAEIETLRAEQGETEARLTEAKETLAQARIELMGGAKKQADIDPLAAAVRDLEAQADTLTRAIFDLDKKYSEAVAAERQAEVAEIDRKITDLRQWMA